MKTYDELREDALQELKNNDELFVDMVNELDSWNGFADGFRCFPMGELDDLFAGCKFSEFLDKITFSFNLHDEYIVDTIYGLDSTNDITEHYRDNVWESELLDNLLDNIDNVWFDNHEEFKTLLEQINEANA